MTQLSTGTGEGTTCGIASGIAYCWGNNDFGQLGDGTKTSRSEAIGVAGLTGTALSVGVGVASACAVTSAAADAGGGGGGVYCWGDNTYGQLGNDTTAASRVPVPVTGLASGVTSVALGTYSACALLSDGTVDCWGANNYGQLGDGTQTTRLVPTKVVGVAGATAISLGWWSTCAVTSGTLQCWGDNTFGQLGSNSFVSTSSMPMAVYGIAGGATDVSVGQTSVCAVVSGAAECWGLGPIGNGTGPITSYTSPLPVTGLASGVTAVSVAAWFACAIVSENVRCWGFNTAGELGNSGRTDAFLPILVPGFP
jgi:alpha-tubulin suppressor-like RCC1 family protein